MSVHGISSQPEPLGRLRDALVAAINHGGSTLGKVKRLIKRRKEWPRSAKLLEQSIDARENLTSVNQARREHLDAQG